MKSGGGLVVACAVAVMIVSNQTIYAEKVVGGREGALFPFRRTQKTGFINATGGVFIEPRFEEAGDFSEGLAWMCVDGRYGYIDNQGIPVIRPQFALARQFTDGLAVVKETGGRWGYIDRTGRIVIEAPPRDREPYRFSEGLAKVFNTLYGKYGYIDRAGKVVTKLRFDDAGKFSEGLAFVEADRKFGYIDKTGKMVVGPR